MRKAFVFAAAFVTLTLPATARTPAGIEGTSERMRSGAGEVKIADVRCNSRGCKELPANCKPIRGYRGLTGGGDTWRCEKKTK